MSHILIPAVSALSNVLNSKQNSHSGLRQHVMATQIKNLSNDINELVGRYDSALSTLKDKRKALSKARRSSESDVVARVKAEIHVLERALLSSQLPFQIAAMKAQLDVLNNQIID